MLIMIYKNSMVSCTMLWLPLSTLLLLLLPHGEAVDTPIVALEGAAPNENYMKVRSSQQYELTCSYRAGYDDVVLSVTWLLYSRPVYTWHKDSNSINVNTPLLGRVDTSPSSSPENVHVTVPHLQLAGGYSCQVVSTKETAISEILQIYVVDVESDTFETHVGILSDMLGYNSNNNNDTDNSNSNYTIVSLTTAAPQPFFPTPPGSGSSGWSLPEPEPPTPSCMLVWSFSTPAIAPKPNITCGYYSHSQDAIMKEVPGGLQLHQLQSGAWRAEIDNTRIPVSEIPVNGRLGCSVTVPHTTYRRMVKFEDGLDVDNLIDSTGCPGLEELTELYGLSQSVVGATTNCRGGHVPDSYTEPAIATISCQSWAMFQGGRKESGWQLRLRCSNEDLSWRRVAEERRQKRRASPQGEMDEEELLVDDPMLEEPKMLGELFDAHTYPWPICVGGISAGSSLFTTSLYWGVTSPLLLMLMVSYALYST